MSIVLAGNNGAFTGTSLGFSAVDKMNQSFIEPSISSFKKETPLELPKIGNKR